LRKEQQIRSSAVGASPGYGTEGRAFESLWVRSQARCSVRLSYGAVANTAVPTTLARGILRPYSAGVLLDCLSLVHEEHADHREARGSHRGLRSFKLARTSWLWQAPQPSLQTSF